MNGETIHVRQATPADLDTIVAYNQAMAKETENKTLDPARAAIGVRRGLDDPNRSLYFVAQIGGAVVGQSMVTNEWSDWRDGFFWWIQSVYVDPDFRRRGVFRALHTHIQALARQRDDVCGLRLYAHRDNRRAIGTYGRLGMTVTDYVLCEEDWSAGQRRSQGG